MHTPSRILRTVLLGALVALGAVLEAGTRLEPDRFLPQLTAQLAQHFAVTGELQLDLLRSWKAPVVQGEDWEMVVVAPPRALTGQMIVHVRLLEGGRNLGEWNLPLRAQLWQDGLGLRRPLSRGELLDPGLFEPRRTDILRDKDTIPHGTDLSALTAVRTVGTGAVLSWRDVARRNLVERGSRIEVVATDGALSITLKGLAMQSGALGDTIVVRNPESRRDFSAVITAENQARVVF